MKVGIMQPYFFPYIGYFSLINEVDVFCFLDDVNFINKGWVNRNYFRSRNTDLLLTLPLLKKSQNKKINEHYIFEKKNFDVKFSKILKESYEGDIVPKIIKKQSGFSQNISEYNIEAIKFCMNQLGIKKKIFVASELNVDSGLYGSHRIIEICKILGATSYINPIGGKLLYNQSDFDNENISLNFLENKFHSNFNYSTLHDLLTMDKQLLIEKLEKYEIT